jgi:predicted peroxiredoxin
MPDDARDLICLITHGTDHELSSVGLTIANGGITAGLKVSIFLSSSGVDLVRKRAADTTQVNPLEPLANLIKDFMARGGTIWACTPCVKSRGYGQEDLLEGVVISGASVVHERIKTGAATPSAPAAAPRPVLRPNRARRDRRQTAPRHADGTGKPRCRARRH